jgi:hypothetical protein
MCQGFANLRTLLAGIDPVCILQDSLTDWSTEAAIMDQVYSGAVLTISSAESPNSWSGIFAHREQYRSVPLHLSSAPGLRLHDVHVCVLPSLGDARDPYEDLEESKLNGRAWTLQERILSPALLHFTRHALSGSVEPIHARKTATFPLAIPSPSISPVMVLQSTKIHIWRGMYYYRTTQGGN